MAVLEHKPKSSDNKSYGDSPRSGHLTLEIWHIFFYQSACHLWEVWDQDSYEIILAIKPASLQHQGSNFDLLPSTILPEELLGAGTLWGKEVSSPSTCPEFT